MQDLYVKLKSENVTEYLDTSKIQNLTFSDSEVKLSALYINQNLKSIYTTFA
jgi:hypothetical protein